MPVRVRLPPAAQEGDAERQSHSEPQESGSNLSNIFHAAGKRVARRHKGGQYSRPVRCGGAPKQRGGFDSRAAHQKLLNETI